LQDETAMTCLTLARPPGRAPDPAPASATETGREDIVTSTLSTHGRALTFSLHSRSNIALTGHAGVVSSTVKETEPPSTTRRWTKPQVTMSSPKSGSTIWRRASNTSPSREEGAAEVTAGSERLLREGRRAARRLLVEAGGRLATTNESRLVARACTTAGTRVGADRQLIVSGSRADTDGWGGRREEEKRPDKRGSANSVVSRGKGRPQAQAPTPARPARAPEEVSEPPSVGRSSLTPFPRPWLGRASTTMSAHPSLRSALCRGIVVRLSGRTIIALGSLGVRHPPCPATSAGRGPWPCRGRRCSRCGRSTFQPLLAPLLEPRQQSGRGHLHHRRRQPADLAETDGPTETPRRGGQKRARDTRPQWRPSSRRG